MSKITVLTPTIGTLDLIPAVISVAKQTKIDDVIIRHILVADGHEHRDIVEERVRYVQALTDYPQHNGRFALNASVFALPDNTGANGWNGHKIYAHYAQLLNTDYLFLLDEDNTFEPNHIESLLPIAEQHGFAWSMRKVYTKKGEYLGIDTKESVGTVLGGGSYALVDTSCWCLRRDQIPMLSRFLEPWSGDRRFTEAMIIKHNGIQQASSGLATMNYYAPDNLIDHFKQVCEL